MAQIENQKQNPFKILLVDDDADLRFTLKTMLEIKGFETVSAEDSVEALNFLKTEKVSLILSDVRMPGGGGEELLETLRKRGEQTPLILMTGYADLSEDEAKSKGAAFLISKPFAIADLIERIRLLNYKGTF